VIERQLSHRESNRTKAAYDKSEHLELRIEMMGWWSDYIDRLCEAKPEDSNVVPLHAAAA
jgi:hypothetical protein